MIKDIRDNLDKISIVLLVGLSLSMSVQVWTSFSNNWFYTVCLAGGALAVELAKIIAIPATYRLAIESDYRFMISAFLAISAVAISVASSTLFFDSAMVGQDQSVVNQERNQVLHSIAIQNAKTYSEHGYATKSGEVMKQLEQSGAPSGAPRDIRASGLLSKASESPIGRTGAFIFVACFIDFAIGALLIMGAPKVATDSDPANHSGKTVNHKGDQELTFVPLVESTLTPNEILIKEIETTPTGTTLSMRAMSKKHSLHQRKVKLIFDDLIDKKVIIKNGSSFVKNTNIRSVKSSV